MSSKNKTYKRSELERISNLNFTFRTGTSIYNYNIVNINYYILDNATREDEIKAKKIIEGHKKEIQEEETESPTKYKKYDYLYNVKEFKDGKEIGKEYSKDILIIKEGKKYKMIDINIIQDKNIISSEIPKQETEKYYKTTEENIFESIETETETEISEEPKIIKKSSIKKKPISKKENKEDKEDEYSEIMKKATPKQQTEWVRELQEYKQQPAIKQIETQLKVKQIKSGKIKKTGNPLIDKENNKLIKACKKAKLRNSYNKREYKYMFITINTKEETDIEGLKDIIRIMDNLSFLQICSYVYEQTGKTEEEKGENKHIHIIAKKKDKIISKSDMIDIIEKRLTGKKSHYINKRKNIDIKYGDEEKDKEEEYKPEEIKAYWEHYIQGKKHPEKLQSYKMTRIWRDENKLKQIYIMKNQKCEIYEYKEPIIKEQKVDLIMIDGENWIYYKELNKYIKL